MTTSGTGRPSPRAASLRVVPADTEASAGAAGAPDGLTELTLDADLPAMLRQSADGDEAAFLVVYDATAARAYGLGCRLLRDPAEVAEVVHEAYLNLWRDSAGFRSSESSPISWVLMAVHRCAVRRLRSKATRPVAIDSVGEINGRADCALVERSSIQQQAVDLAYYGGYTYTDIEQMTGLSVGTARVRIRDGLLELDDRAGRG